MNNIFNAGKEDKSERKESWIVYPVADDPPDDPDEMPRVQRIVFAEKPLEFPIPITNEAMGIPFSAVCSSHHFTALIAN